MQQHSNLEWKPELCIPFSSASSVCLSFRHSTFCWRLFFWSSHALRDIIVSFYFCSFQKLKTIVGMGFFGSRRIIEITEVQCVAMLGFHKLCCHVGISQIMLPCFGVHKFCFQWQKERVRMYLSKTWELALIGALSSRCLDLSCDCCSMPLYVNFNTHHRYMHSKWDPQEGILIYAFI
jgi:hypothetical protein